jgi:hypothetical protein
MKRLKNWLYKDSRLVVTKSSDNLPDGGKLNPVEVNMLTFTPYSTLEKSLVHNGDSAELTGTYGLNPWDVFNPFKENTNIVWLMMYQQGLIKDVAAELIHPQHGSILVTVNNPQVGKPYAVFYNSPIEAAIPSPLVGSKIYLNEGDSAFWTSENGWALQVRRNDDTYNKEFLVII